MAVPSSTTLSAVTAPASLYVGELHGDVSDGQLFDAFSEFKSLTSVRICRDSSTGRSLCYGYVNFISPHDAIRAIETKNHTPLNGKLMRVMWSRRDPDARRSGVGNVFVKNLSESIDNVILHDIFGKFGTVLSCKVAMFEDGKSKGHGFVQFESEESANAAIEKLNDSVVGDKQIYVGKFVKKSDRVLPSPEAKYTNLYVKNLDPIITDEHLHEKFSEFGKIVSLTISKAEDGSSRGFGFINFENPDNAKQAMERLNGTELGSKVLYVGRAQKKAEREQILRYQFEVKRNEQIMKFKGSNVYVKNIDDDVTDEELNEHFSQCGIITSAKLMRDDKGRSKGFGFVCFSSSEEAIKAVNTFHGFMFHRKPLYVAIAQRKEDRKAQLQMQYAHRMTGLAGPSAAVIPGGYPPFYYTPPSGVVPQVTPRPGMMFPQPLDMRPGWRGNGFPHPTRPAFQLPQVPFMPNGQRQHKQNRGRVNGHVFPQGSTHSVSYTQQQPAQPLTSSKDPSNQAKYVPNGRAREVSKVSGVSSAVPNSTDPVSQQGSEVLSSMLAAASPDEQKQMLGEKLYPLVQKHKPDLVAKITGMLLEMDNAELLLLLESPDSLAAKVEEAVQVLKISKTKLPGQDTLHPSYHLSAEVAVN
ncbi:polyadenylate-binding protein 7 isoform X2 [Mercurialis annua]|uniref:polyadenylate-binding protein 7 isoform X2 n=1 Tax=Mercurialis annua TaxID=3986 RepID=UPI00215EBCFF|nr:polyadenylate-binding protein 7 isoform X2 [Mercurialis annua]